MIEIQRNISLAPLTSWLVGGPADYLAMPATVEDVIEAQTWARDKNLPVTILGGGSNVLISDRGIRGLTLCLKKLSGATTSEENGHFKVAALSGTGKSELLKIFLKARLAPALFLAGLPGDTAGGVVMNAGVSEEITPREFVEITEWFDVLKPDGKIQRYHNSDVIWKYRHSEGWQPGIIVRVGLSWPNTQDPTILEKVKNANKLRLSKQPLDLPSCGSVFVNPVGHKSAQLIDACGLKGFTIGGAQVSKKHANFIVNLGEAKAVEIWQVIEHVKQTVFQEKNVALITEVIRLGEWS
jgi:UDP-N-acetylmuramate dehydrogenase